MPHFVGLDASKATTSICVLDQDGETIREGVVPTEPKAIVAFLRGERRRYRRVGLESMSMASWLYEGLARAGLPVICIESRHAHGVLKARLNKTDRNDARGIAELMRVGVYKAVHVKTIASQQSKMLLTARRHLLKKCVDVDNFIRGALLQLGIKIKRGRTYAFAKDIEALTPAARAVRQVINSLMMVRRSIETEVRVLTKRIGELVAEDEVCRRFMTVPGVGPLTALSFRAAIDVPGRFRHSREVGVHLGLTPRRFSSGTIDRGGRISKCGDAATRASLFLAAQSMLRTGTRGNWLKSWGLSIAASRGRGKAIVAVARRIATILHRMWVDGTDFRNEPRAA